MSAIYYFKLCILILKNLWLSTKNVKNRDLNSLFDFIRNAPSHSIPAHQQKTRADSFFLQTGVVCRQKKSA